MKDKKLLIVGIDPGITTAFAVLDIEGNLIHLTSSKQLDLSSIISETLGLGKVVLVGTDKANVPSLVGNFATKLGAKTISPKEDLKVDEKKKMGYGFEFGDEHQKDALASALFAYKSAKPLLDKIDIFAKNSRKQNIKDRIKELVVTKSISIKSAVGIIEKKEEADRIMEKAVVEKKLSENDFLKLYGKLKNYESEIRLLRAYCGNLSGRLQNIEKSRLKETPKTSSKQLIDFRESRIKFLENLLKSKGREIEDLKSIARKLNLFISKANEHYILKKLDNLGQKEFNFKNKTLNIKKNDIILVDDPNIASNEVVELLKENVLVIVHKKPISAKMRDSMPFVFMSAKSLKIDEDKYFGFIEKKQFEMEKSKLDWARKIIDDYKREKQQSISG